MKQRIYIVIPVFNEAPVVEKVIRGVQSYGYTHIIVVDDGSEDTTYSNVIKTGALILRHSINRGKGAAIKTGIEAAKQLDADIVVTFDGDGQHNPKDIQSMINGIQEGYNIVLGNRFTKKNRIPALKRAGNLVANFIAYLFYGVWFKDTQCGLRAYDKRALWLMNTSLERYGFDTQVLSEIRYNNLTYIETPVNVRYTRYSQEKENRQHAWSGILTMFRVIRKA